MSDPDKDGPIHIDMTDALLDLPVRQLVYLTNVALNTMDLQTLAEVFLAAGVSAEMQLVSKPEMTFDLSNGKENTSHTDSVIETTLTNDQRKALELSTLGLTNHEIGEAMGSNEATIKRTFCKVFKKLGAKNRTQAAIFARERGWINSNGVEND